ncbi:HAMP domain-containing protein [Melghirimyces profundicolus]|uniref:HAMP domain-containing protein n=1 Tax=Melghirimyces profundicolus TaxID=1242148 RepID=A0A2T6ATR9_9BACL|nr:histidine kinase [Melghirimyces profundicolus]PTX47116.1 HAMP domain-containing protein [Melghirimyces profundicolus]
MKNSLTYKMIVYLLLATIVPIVTSSVITYQLTTHAAKDKAIAESQNLLFYGASNLVQYMEVIDKLSLSFYYDVSLGGTLYKVIEEGRNDYRSKMTIHQTLLRISNFLPDIYQVRLDILKNRKSYQMIDKNLILESTMIDPKNSKSPSEHGQVIPTHDSDPSGMKSGTSYTSKQVVSYYRPIYKIPKNNKLSTKYMDWIIVKGIPYHILYKDARSVALTNSLVYVALLAFLVISTIWISIHFTKPIKQLTRTITKIEQGNVHAELTTTRTDEVGVLIRRFQQMMSTINNLILREFRLELANKTNQLKALQAQINPHFLNNALQSIGTLALQRKERKIYSLISSLGQMMNYQMLSSEIIVPFSDEVRYVQSYIELQKQRFEDELIVLQDYDKEALAVPIPKMILQPLVENYFKHGFLSNNVPGQLCISAVITEKNRLKVVVEDNGPGIEESERLMLQTRLDTLENHWIHEVSDKRIGLTNVLSRLRLYCGPDASMEIVPRSTGGLCVTLIIPVIGDGNFENK